LQEIKRELKDMPGIDDALQVKIYDDLPNMPIYAVHDDKHPQADAVFHGFFLTYGSGSTDLPAAELRRPAAKRTLYFSISSFPTRMRSGVKRSP
jgi:hypothetical protein